jgi:hypothetical protein
MRIPILIRETSILLDPRAFGGQQDVRIIVQVHWDAIREGFLLRAGIPRAPFDPGAWKEFVAKTLRLSELWMRDGYVHQVLWWPGGGRLPSGWYSIYCFPAGQSRVLLGVTGYLGTGEGVIPCVGSTCFCEQPWWIQGGDYLNYLFLLGPCGERHAA